MKSQIVPEYTNYTHAAFWMVAGLLGLTTTAILAREIGRELDTFETMFYRSLIGIVIVLGAATLFKTRHQISTQHISKHIQRNIVHFTGQNLWFYALTVLPLAHVSALEFTTPLWIALLAPFFLGERLTLMKLLVVGLGFAGILIITRPDAQPINVGVVAALSAAVAFAMTTILTKKLTRHASVTEIVFYLTVIQAVISFVFVGFDGHIPWPSSDTRPLLFGIGVSGLAAHFCIARALSLAPAGFVVPIDFLRLPLSVALGVLFYNEAADLSFYIGSALVICANLLNLKLPKA